MTVDTCGYSGNAVAFVNADLAIPECAGPAGTPLGCFDNWSDVKVVPCVQQTLTSYLPLTFEQAYSSSCAIGSRPVWQFLTYSGTAPSNASGRANIKFEAQTAKSGVYGPLVVAANTASGDPAICSASTPGCPKNLFTILGSSAAYDTALKLKITLTPTPDSLLPATLQSWQVSYSCVPVE